MTFDYVKFLTSNNLTSTSKLNKKAKLLAENYIDLRPINSLGSNRFGNTVNELEDIDNLEAGEDDDYDEPVDDWNAPGKKDEFDREDDTEPTVKDIKSGKESKESEKHFKLDNLLKQKDSILAKFKTGQITIDQYKREIGNIPQQIKNLQASIDQELSVDDEKDNDEDY